MTANYGRSGSEEQARVPLDDHFFIPSQMLAEILNHLVAALPNEGVGLIGVDPATPDRAVTFFPGTNVDLAPNRYTMEPTEVLSALRAMADQKLRLGAIVHSHPSSAPTPSATDRREAYYDEIVMLIVQCTPPPPHYRAWRVRRSEQDVMMTEAAVVVDHEGGHRQW